MRKTYQDDQGRIMVGAPAGGGGGGMTSFATRPATAGEIMTFHIDNLARAEAELAVAHQAREAAKEAHDKHRALQAPVVGAALPPGPLDRNSLTAQEATDAPDAHPGDHTIQQGQPDQPGQPGYRGEYLATDAETAQAAADAAMAGHPTPGSPMTPRPAVHPAPEEV